MADNAIDVKTEATSSTALDVKPGTDSSSVKTATTNADVKATPAGPTTMAEAVRQAIKPVEVETKDSSSKDTDAEKEAESDVQKLNKTEGEEADKSEEVTEMEEVTSEEETESEADKTDKTDETDKGPIPYERFQEQVQKANTSEQKYKEAEPLIEAQTRIEDFCQANGITNDDFKNAMEIAALLKRDPLAAYEKIKPIYEGIQVLQGEKISPELQKAVEDGEMTLDYAKRLAKAEAQKQFGVEQRKVTEQQQAFNAQQKLIADTQTSLNAWQNDKKVKDPSYKPKTKSGSPDGLWELVNDKWFALMQTTPPKSAQEAVSLAEKAYTQVKASLQSFVPRPPARKSLTSNMSSATTTSNGKPKTMLDAVKQQLASRS